MGTRAHAHTTINVSRRELQPMRDGCFEDLEKQGVASVADARHPDSPENTSLQMFIHHFECFDSLS